MIKWLERKRFFSITCFFLLAVEIFFFSSIPGIKAGSVSIIDLSIIYHFCVFFLLNFFLLISLIGEEEIKIKHFFIALAFSFIYSILDEIHQIFVPSRYPDIKDILTDSAGIFSSGIIYLLSKRSKKIISRVRGS